MRRLCASIVLACCILGSAHAQKPVVEHIDVIDPGIYAIESSQVKKDSDTASGELFYAKVARLITKTTTVEAKIGVGFGFKFNVIGQSASNRVDLTSIIIYPPAGIRNPGTGDTIFREVIRRTPKLNSPESYAGFSFEHEWEIVTGTWTFEIWGGERKLVSQSFQVVTPL